MVNSVLSTFDYSRRPGFLSEWVRETFYFLEPNPDPGLTAISTLYFGGKDTRKNTVFAHKLIAGALKRYEVQPIPIEVS